MTSFVLCYMDIEMDVFASILYSVFLWVISGMFSAVHLNFIILPEIMEGPSIFSCRFKGICQK